VDSGHRYPDPRPLALQCLPVGAGEGETKSLLPIPSPSVTQSLPESVAHVIFSPLLQVRRGTGRLAQDLRGSRARPGLTCAQIKPSLTEGIGNGRRR
jgi:hypothetical protein